MLIAHKLGFQANTTVFKSQDIPL